jgi:hypothetical protein
MVKLARSMICAATLRRLEVVHAMLGDSALCDIDRLLGLRLERSVMACKIGVVSFFLSLGFLGDVEMACRAAYCVSKKVMSRFGDDIELTLRVAQQETRRL